MLRIPTIYCEQFTVVFPNLHFDGDFLQRTKRACLQSPTEILWMTAVLQDPCKPSSSLSKNWLTTRAEAHMEFLRGLVGRILVRRSTNLPVSPNLPVSVVLCLDYVSPSVGAKKKDIPLRRVWLARLGACWHLYISSGANRPRNSWGR